MGVGITYTTLDNQHLEFRYDYFDNNKISIKIIRFEIKDDWIHHLVYIKEDIIVVIPIENYYF